MVDGWGGCIIISIIVAIVADVNTSRASSAPKDAYNLQGKLLPSFESV